MSAAGGSVRSASAERTEPPLSPPHPAIGGTSLRHFPQLVAAVGGSFELAAKLEFENPTGSVKDRAANEIVRGALADGSLGTGRTLIDASSGNTGVAYAALGARLGFPVELCLPANANPMQLRRIRGAGAIVTLTDALEGTDGAQRVARERATGDPARYFYPDQYNHPANPGAHYRTTGPEIWRQTDGRLTHFVAGVGTGGTVSGTGRYLKERRPGLVVVGVEPSGPIHGLEGLKHLPTALRPSTYDARVVDRTIRVETEDAIAMQRQVWLVEGLRVGRSSAAATLAALEIGREAPGAFVVTIFPDAGHAGPEGAP